MTSDIWRVRFACVAHGWWERFCQRHLEISLGSASVPTHSPVKGASPEALNEYFDILEYMLEKYDIQSEPGHNMFNMNETGMQLDPKSLEVAVPKGMKNPSLITCGNKSQITVVSASDFYIPPMIVWDRKILI